MTRGKFMASGLRERPVCRGALSLRRGHTPTLFAETGLLARDGLSRAYSLLESNRQGGRLARRPSTANSKSHYTAHQPLCARSLAVLLFDESSMSSGASLTLCSASCQNTSSRD